MGVHDINNTALEYVMSSNSMHAVVLLSSMHCPLRPLVTESLLGKRLWDENYDDMKYRLLLAIRTT